MNLIFSKYQGAGNDFIMLDNRTNCYDFITTEMVQFLCNRKLGVGADGLIKINSKEGFHFGCDYYNADGSQSFCGNGARCAVSFAKSIGIIAEVHNFFAIDGPHEAFFENTLVNLQMNDVSFISNSNNCFELNTGSPHHVSIIENLKSTDVVKLGKEIRYSEKHRKYGINANFVELIDSSSFQIRTYERGVEDETLACGTGITAAALCMSRIYDLKGQQKITAFTPLFKLSVTYLAQENGGFSDIRLIGPVKHVFDGSLILNE
jgi:diaminopimelate epimerase